ncbi:STAS domain-containing protein [Actinosynnema sp. ALI-1.44]|uniref:STAS domain-containing protein n=1 Tax=Actinosynnema sp. ALI-1.44 TaxID=1933779 RepID=UPI00143CC5B2|nr:STAS domain-containing protein [Actinosynnema sp. ALI-1.44]
MQCRVEERDHAVIVSVTGAVDLVGQAAFADAVRDALGREPSSVVIDLAGVTFLASPGLAVLVEAQENAMRAHKSLQVAVGNGIAARSLEVTGLAQVLSLVPDTDTALGG